MRRESLLDVAFVRRFLARHSLCEAPVTEPRIALTFDDGPHPRYTTALLDLLAAESVPATFFLVGERVRRFPDLARRIVAEGHEVGHHGDRHIPILLLPPPFLTRDILRAGRTIETITGSRPRYFRPPMGWIHPWPLRVVRDLGYAPVIGSIHPRDFTRPGVDVIVDRVLRRLAPGAIVILHDGGWSPSVDRSQTVEAVRRLIGAIRDRGYRFQTLSELTGRTP